MPVMRGFHYYETGCIPSQTAGSYAEPFIPFPNGKKVLGFKIYKNGRVDLVFRSQDDAYAFAKEYLTEVAQP